MDENDSLSKINHFWNRWLTWKGIAFCFLLLLFPSLSLPDGATWTDFALLLVLYPFLLFALCIPAFKSLHTTFHELLKKDLNISPTYKKYLLGGAIAGAVVLNMAMLLMLAFMVFRHEHHEKFMVPTFLLAAEIGGSGAGWFIGAFLGMIVGRILDYSARHR